MNYRFELYRYSAHHWAVDCKECNCKVVNLTPDKSGLEIIVALIEHERKVHSTK